MTVLETIMISSFYLFIALIINIQAYLGLRTLLFGITLPAEALQDTAVRGIRQNLRFAHRRFCGRHRSSLLFNYA
ncbi:hypothetical protein GCM10010912_51290 [Paenibacillus albidus]|uniref:Uncharacterized protein n=1 Tax=Paenibacillus albidus TaxID=2041023 RepID=A0A917FTK2_9BACL|nr:hypothetical protein [Paenibacillus albidus]GGG00158.1 hypothetical protein GCM10010912_51290 [Paenibacillus albidus]